MHTNHVITVRALSYRNTPRSSRRTLKLAVAYDGSRYAGWQVQKFRPQTADRRPQAEQKPTIQGTLERVFGTILQERVKVIGSGRTDAGVHALAQVAHVRTGSAVSCRRLLRSLNQLLPPDIAVMHLEEAGHAFHARFSAVRKRYRYRIFTAPVVPPFIRPYVHHAPAPLNVRVMRREARALNGRHDFQAFAKQARPSGGTVRAVTDVELRRRGSELQLEIEGNGFLHTMVRSIAGTLLDVGRGRLPAGTVRRMLRTRKRALAGTTAPARGLTLVSVEYSDRADRVMR